MVDYLYFMSHFSSLDNQVIHLRKYSAFMCSTFSITHHSHAAGTTYRGNLRFSILPKYTSTRRLEEPGIEPPAYWLEDDPLYLPRKEETQKNKISQLHKFTHLHKEKKTEQNSKEQNTSCYQVQEFQILVNLCNLPLS